jgi:hypothetical protein
MNAAKQMGGLLIALLLIIAFLNRGQFAASSGTGGSNLQVGYYGSVK